MLNPDGTITLMPGADVMLNWTAEDAREYTSKTIADFEKVIAEKEAELARAKQQLEAYKELAKKVVALHENLDKNK